LAVGQCRKGLDFDRLAFFDAKDVVGGFADGGDLFPGEQRAVGQVDAFFVQLDGGCS